MARAQGAGTSMRERVTAQAQACASVQCVPARTPRAAGRVRAPCPGTAHRIALSISSALSRRKGRASRREGRGTGRPLLGASCAHSHTYAAGVQTCRRNWPSTERAAAWVRALPADPQRPRASRARTCNQRMCAARRVRGVLIAVRCALQAVACWRSRTRTRRWSSCRCASLPWFCAREPCTGACGHPYARAHVQACTQTYMCT